MQEGSISRSVRVQTHNMVGGALEHSGRRRRVRQPPVQAGGRKKRPHRDWPVIRAPRALSAERSGGCSGGSSGPREHPAEDKRLAMNSPVGGEGMRALRPRVLKSPGIGPCCPSRATRTRRNSKQTLKVRWTQRGLDLHPFAGGGVGAEYH